MLIDTGSSDAILNPGVYRPSSSSQDTGRPFEISYATTNPDGSGRLTASGQVYRDVISQHGADLAVNQQALGDIRKPTTPPTFPRDGLIGYAGRRRNALGASSFIRSLCDQGSLSSCRFGLALKTDWTGELYYGTVPADLFAGSLATVPIQGEWAVFGALTLNGKTIWADVKLITDSGTAVIFGPTEQVSHLFQKAGIEAARAQNGITGYYRCSAPPKIGFSLGGRNFNVLPEALAFAKEGDNCTASVRGSDAFGNNWLVGQPFFQGRYIDHSIRDGTMGFADRK
ncbi:hypothetical protein C2857_006569 [Epichloe festucae Fl1]|uniref:Peptidase A1 domain-containing protein n=1 Tax=Epichloe festucae (strain Fl1) TaxID=877507 RepID=A0A7S9PWE3_EPIFF|nr:hypothetical protein C2857_006569 [Epichloe festucae Fl1]